ncbi:chromosomal protein D1-like [Thalassophryne amazonica]|uniref:chromosomal protein D1-like n=1 Tax=Thalassophryne amazonica TaxID=390379 RepID=UPI0014721DA0|nr:chromosomal protein D1-like [Thalassophryne amazonica]XP_034016507.1 chromosomal protein D1-like [Thalassophryne amazonica]
MEEEMRLGENEQVAAGSNEGQSSAEMFDSSPVPTKRGRGRPKGSSKLKISVKDVSLPEIHSDVSSGASAQLPKRRGHPKKVVSQHPTAQPHRGRGRPKGLRSKKDASNEDHSPKKRGRPKGSLNKSTLEKAAASRNDLGENVPNGSSLPKKPRGRPKGSSMKRKAESIEDNDSGSSIPRKRGRPKKPHVIISAELEVVVSTKKLKRGRPRKEPAKRGRPRKFPLHSSKDRKKAAVWKPLGRPRKYPRLDPPEGVPLVLHRGRGRPRKSESKKGAHLRKKKSPSLNNVGDGIPRKRGRPLGTAKNTDEPGGKRGHPKGSVKNKANLYTAPPVPDKNDSAAVEEDREEQAEDSRRTGRN